MAIVQLEGLGKLKNPMTSSGIEPATFRLVAECLNQLRYRVLLPVEFKGIKYLTMNVWCVHTVCCGDGLT
jgi:hypothetical protein